MLHVYKRMFQGMFTATFGEGATAGEINEATDTAGYISANNKRIIEELNKLDLYKDGGTRVGADQMLNTDEVVLSRDKAALDKVLQAVGLDQYTLATGVPMSEVVGKLGEFSGASVAVQSISKVERAKPEVRGENPEYKVERKEMKVSPELALMDKRDEKWMKK